MQVVYPSYYHRFACSASACPDTCCQGWGISIDRETYGRYMAVGGLMGAKLRSHIDHRKRRFLLNQDGQCMFLDRHGLCGLCVDLGESMMCRTCRIYPRHEESYGDLAEVSLSLSCPAAARLVLEQKEPVIYQTREKTSGASLHGEGIGPADDLSGLPLPDRQLLDGLLRLRQAMFFLLRRTELKADVRAGAVLALARDGQRRLRRQAYDQIGGLCARYETAPAKSLERKMAPFREMGFQRRSLEEEYLDELERLEEISGGFKELLRSARRGPAGKAPAPLEWPLISSQGLNLMEYFLYLLYPGAVYDGNGWTKAGLAAFSLLAVRRLAAGIMAAGDEQLPEQAFIRAAWMYSRQVEHSDQNLERLENFVKKSSSCALPQLLACLLGGEEADR